MRSVGLGILVFAGVIIAGLGQPAMAQPPSLGASPFASQLPSLTPPTSPSLLGTPPGGTSATPRSRSRSRLSRMSRLPKMYGDSLRTGKLYVLSSSIPSDCDDEGGGSDEGGSSECESVITESQLVLPSFGSLQIADNNSPIPTDRVYFLYQHFHNAIASGFSTDFDAATVTRNDLNIFTVGFEKTFFDELTSIDVRLPMVSTNSPGRSLDNPTAFEPGTLSGIGVILKGILWQNERMVFSGGLGINFSTGNAQTTVFTELESYRVDRDGTVFTPFFGFASSFTERGFFQTFAQLNLPSVADTLTATSDLGLTTSRITQQDTLTFNVSKGHWFMQNPNHPFLTGLAGLIELHYTTALGKDTDVELITPGDVSSLIYTLERYDTLNLTTGMLFQVRNSTNVRVGVVAPLRTDAEDKMFDAEVQVSINHFF